MALALLVLAVAVGCFSADGERHHRRALEGERSIDELRRSLGWYDLAAQSEIQEIVSPKELFEWAERIRAMRKPAVPSPKKNVLIVSGGGIYGAAEQRGKILGLPAGLDKIQIALSHTVFS